MITHTNDSYQIPSQNKTKSKLHILKNAKIQCVNMKWILLVLWKSQSGHDSVHRRTDGRTGRRPLAPTSAYGVQIGAKGV